jgi:hypothetical protein
MQGECPFCYKNYKDVKKHIKNTHSTDKIVDTTTPEGVLSPLQAQIKPVIKESVANVFSRQRDNLQKQNEVILLQIQQNALLKSLQTGTLPGENSSSNSPIKQTLDLIKSVRENFPATDEKDDPNDILLMEGMDVLKQYLASRNIVTPSPPDPPAPPWEQIEDEIPSPPLETELVEPDEAINKNGQIPPPDKPMDNSILPEAREHKLGTDKDKTTS